MNTTLTLMSGLPRIGKSTWIEANKQNAIIVSPDIMRTEIYGHQHHIMANDWIFSLGKSMTYLLLLQNKDVIIDATNIRKTDRENWYKVAHQAGSRLETTIDLRVVTVTTGNIDKDIALSLAHNEICPKDKAVPARVIKDMAKSMSYCGDSEKVSLRCPTPNQTEPHSGYEINSMHWNENHNDRCTLCGEILRPFRPLVNLTSVRFNPEDGSEISRVITFDKLY